MNREFSRTDPSMSRIEKRTHFMETVTVNLALRPTWRVEPTSRRRAC
jgi:hypothetical protein